MRSPLSSLAAFVLISTLAAAARAEPRQTVTGLDMYLDRPDAGYYDRVYRARGVAYEVIGIAGLRPAPGATVRARLGGSWVESTAGESGAFEIVLNVPAEPDFEEGEGPRLEVELRSGQHQRDYSFPLSLQTPLVVVARTDRRQYRPGETVHVWSRVNDAVTGRPLPGIPVLIRPAGRREALEMVTGASGVAAVDLREPASDGVTRALVRVEAGRGRMLASATAMYDVGARPTTDLFVTVAATPETVSPGQLVSIEVQVRSPSGFPVRGARVSLGVSTQRRQLVTDPNGNAVVELTAPEYSASERGAVAISGTASHPGYGVADLNGSYRVRRPNAVEVDLLLPRGGLVPDVNERVILSVEMANGEPPPAGTPVELRGAALAGGRARATTDRHGFAMFPVRLDAGTYAQHVGSSECESSAATTIQMIVEGATPQEATLCVPVLVDALAAPSLRRPAVGPGEAIEVSVQRRPDVARRPVAVELLCLGAPGPLDARVASPASSLVRLTAPSDRLGVCFVRARPLLDVADSPTYGFGALEPLLVRPAAPSFPALELDHDLYSIRGRARLTVRSPAAAPRSWVAVLVRDLAQHQGEVPFDEYFLRRELRQAVLDPSTPQADLLVRAALAAYAQPDDNVYEQSPAGPDAVHDAARLAIELRGQVGEWMVAVERLLENALAAGSVDDVSTGDGSARRFVPDVVDLALDGEPPPETLGQGSVTADMLSDFDPAFSFDSVARRVARRRLVHLLGVLASHLDPEGSDESRPRGRSTEPPERWLSELVRTGVLSPTDLHDPWGHTFVLRRTGRRPRFTFAVEADGFELLSPGPDGRVGTPDDVFDPLARAVAQGSLYARVSGEDRLMAELSALSPGAQALSDLLAAYDRLTDEAVEELIGEGLHGFGAGGGGAGYGRGAGGLMGHRATAPSIRTGAVTAYGGALAGIVREDFPATLFFAADAPISPTGSTTFDIPLAEAPTTYVVEAILWRTDGWVWSASTEIRVDQDLIVDAPVPEAATIGDDVVLPLRVSNRTKTTRVVRLGVTGSDELGVAPIETGAVEVPPRDAIEVPVVLPLRRASTGQITIAAYDTKSQPLDAVRRPIVVRPDKRRARDEAEAVLRGRGELTLVVPEGSEPAGTNEITLAVGPAIFRRDEHASWARWIDGLTGREGRRPGEASRVTDWELRELADGGDPATLAQLVGADWSSDQVRDAVMDRAIEVLTDSVEGIEPGDAASVRLLERLLMLLAPATLQARAGARPALRRPLQALVRALRIKVESGAALFAEAPWLAARGAAALLWTAPAREGGDRAEELLERARAAVVAVEDDRWLEGGRDDLAVGGDELFVASILLALAELRVGRDDAAFGLVRSMARLLRSSDGGLPEVRALVSEDRALAAVAAAALGDGQPLEALTVIVDGERRRVALEDDLGSLSLPALGAGGEHRIELVDAGAAIVLVQATAEYTVDWNAPPPHPGPFSLRIEGAAGRVDERTGLKLVIRNQIPRVVRQPVVEITLPAGAEVDEEARQRLTCSARARPEVTASVLILRLCPLGPRGEVEIPLPWLWTTAGRLNGLGVMAWAAERPQAISISPSRPVDVTRGDTTTGGAP